MSDIGEGISKLSLHDEHGAQVPSKVQEARDDQRAQLAPMLEDMGWNKKVPSPDLEAKWASSARRYEWQDEYGVVAPRMPDLEKILFHDPHIMRVGAKFEGFVLLILLHMSS